MSGHYYYFFLSDQRELVLLPVPSSDPGGGVSAGSSAAVGDAVATSPGVPSHWIGSAPALLPPADARSAERFFSRTVEAAGDLREHVYKSVSRLLLNSASFAHALSVSAAIGGVTFATSPTLVMLNTRAAMANPKRLPRALLLAVGIAMWRRR